MHDYELTDRGKILIAIIIAVIFLLVPAGILLYSALSGQSPDELGAGASGTPPPSAIEAPPSRPLNSPPPYGGGFNPPDVGAQGDADPPRDAKNPTKPADIGTVGGSPSDGVLSFVFSPGLQDALDDKTIALLGEFLSAAGNTESNRITIELPRMSAEAENTVISAIASAFASYGIAEQRLAFSVDPAVTAEETLVVHLSFVPYQSK